MSGAAPVILLDEVIAHLDPARRAALYEALEGLGAQIWMTGADPAAFVGIAPRGELCEVAPGRVRRSGARPVSGPS
jgi:DNA replication and repair protein RecF